MTGLNNHVMPARKEDKLEKRYKPCKVQILKLLSLKVMTRVVSMAFRIVHGFNLISIQNDRQNGETTKHSPMQLNDANSLQRRRQDISRAIRKTSVSQSSALYGQYHMLFINRFQQHS